MKVFHCDHCGQLLFFENFACVRCGRALAFVPERTDILSLDLSESATVDKPARWTSPIAKTSFRLCDNYAKHNVCNWALAEHDPDAFCRACRLTTTIPNLSRPGNDRLWYQLEVAKRRLLYTLDQLAIPFASRREDPVHGLGFEFLEDPEPGMAGPAVMTGHKDGVITINIAEADEATRVKRRLALGEPYRTVLGHFRHEIGHYFWARIIEGTSRIDAFRALFGDERFDYQTALNWYYAEGPKPGWQDSYISAYATMHPWEDWAETWAHYLHMADTLETAAACGISIEPRRSDEPSMSSVPNPLDDPRAGFDQMMEGWSTIAYVLNNLNRGLGTGDAYPFVLSRPTVDKLRFVHDVIGEARRAHQVPSAASLTARSPGATASGNSRSTDR